MHSYMYTCTEAYKRAHLARTGPFGMVPIWHSTSSSPPRQARLAGIPILHRTPTFDPCSLVEQRGNYVFQGQPPLKMTATDSAAAQLMGTGGSSQPERPYISSDHFDNQVTTVLHLPIMSQNTVSTTKTYQDDDDDDTVTSLSRGHTQRSLQSKLSHLSCKIRRKPDDITVEKELTKWAKRGTDYLEGAIVRSSFPSSSFTRSFLG